MFGVLGASWGERCERGVWWAKSGVWGEKRCLVAKRGVWGVKRGVGGIMGCLRSYYNK